MCKGVKHAWGFCSVSSHKGERKRRSNSLKVDLTAKLLLLLYSEHVPSAGCAGASWAVRHYPKGQDTTGRSQLRVPSRGGGDAKGEFTR